MKRMSPEPGQAVETGKPPAPGSGCTNLLCLTPRLLTSSMFPVLKDPIQPPGYSPVSLPEITCQGMCSVSGRPVPSSTDLRVDEADSLL